MFPPVPLGPRVHNEALCSSVVLNAHQTASLRTAPYARGRRTHHIIFPAPMSRAPAQARTQTSRRNNNLKSGMVAMVQAA